MINPIKNKKCINKGSLLFLSPLYVFLKFLINRTELIKGSSIKESIPRPGAQGPEGVAMSSKKIIRAALT